MQQDIGIVCGACDSLLPIEAKHCFGCGRWAALDPRNASDEPAAAAAVTPEVQEEDMEQVRHYVCNECASSVPPGHKFCGVCGANVPQDVLERQDQYFGEMQQPGKARLILIRGDQGVEGLSYLLHGNKHIVGREDAQILFPEDDWLDGRHANFFYRAGTLMVRDEGSTNGVYFRAREEVQLSSGDQFLCGQQLFRVEHAPKDDAEPGEDGTHFYASPRYASAFRLVQRLEGGAEGMVYCARGTEVSIGREDSDMNFPDDQYLSSQHATVRLDGDDFFLLDKGSRNGSFVRIAGEQPLENGDYIFMGRQLLRVEITE